MDIFLRVFSCTMGLTSCQTKVKRRFARMRNIFELRST